MRVTKSSNNIAGWMESFLNGMAKKIAGENEEKMEKDEVIDEDQMTSVAEINISDLPKITWNDETFYVKLTDKGAEILNEFGNTVNTLDNVHTVEDADKALNGQQVVVATDEEEGDLTNDTDFGQELEKVVAGVAPNEDVEFEDDLQKSAANEEVKPQGEEQKPVEDQTNEFDPKPSTVVEDDNDVIEAIATGFSQLEQKIAFLEDQYKTLSQEYARVQQLTPVDNGAPAEEQKHYEESATNTQHSIDDSKNHDITTPAGRVELSKEHIESPIDSVEQTEVKPEEAPKAEETIDEKGEEKEDKLPPLDTRAPKTEEDKKSTPAPTPTVEKHEDETKKEDSEDEVDDEEKKPVVAALDSKDSKIFKKAICPTCGDDESLIRSASVNHIQGIYCASCSSEYAVNLDSEEIFKYQG